MGGQWQEQQKLLSVVNVCGFGGKGTANGTQLGLLHLPQRQNHEPPCQPFVFRVPSFIIVQVWLVKHKLISVRKEIAFAGACPCSKQKVEEEDGSYKCRWIVPWWQNKKCIKDRQWLVVGVQRRTKIHLLIPLSLFRGLLRSLILNPGH